MAVSKQKVPVLIKIKSIQDGKMDEEYFKKLLNENRTYLQLK